MFLNPQSVIEQFELQSGAKVADLGAGSGVLTLAAAEAVGEAGRVVAIEVQKPMLERLRSLARQHRLSNIETIWGDLERPQGTHLKGASIDALIASNVLFQIEDKPAFAEEAFRILKKGGRLLLIDWSDSYSSPASSGTAARRGMGPAAAHVVSEKQARLLFEGAGFQFTKPIEAGEHHYGLIFKKV